MTREITNIISSATSAKSTDKVLDDLVARLEKKKVIVRSTECVYGGLTNQ